MIYLATPYTNLTPEEREYYFAISCKVAAILFNEGKHVFAPIIYAHPIAIRHKLPADWHFWKEFDEKMLSVCDELWVLMLPGWEDSFGIKQEAEIAHKDKKPVKFLDPKDFGILC